jgi:hypothetical protein
MQCPSIAMKENLTSRTRARAWAACPNCLFDLRPKGTQSKRPYLDCPFCGAPIMPIWWLRIPWLCLGLILSFGIPASVGLVGTTLFFAGIVFWYPANVIAYVLFFSIVPPKYMRRREHYTITTPFHR